MLNLKNVELLYNETVLHTIHTPDIGRTLVGNCLTVHFGMLQRAREYFGSDLQFTIGSIELNGNAHFDFTLSDFASWEAGNTKPKYNLHAWYSLPQENEIIDLTLAATLRHVKKGNLPKEITYLTSAKALNYGIVYLPFTSGGDLLFRLNMIKSIHGA